MTSCADQCRLAGSHRTIAPARVSAPAALATRPIGTLSIDADAEWHGLGAVLLISRGSPRGCGTKTRGRHQCGTVPPDGANAERWQPRSALRIALRSVHERGTVELADQNADHWRALLRTQIRIACQYGCGSQAAADNGTYRYQWTVRGLAQVRLYYSTAVLLCGYAHTTISAYDHMRMKA